MNGQARPKPIPVRIRVYVASTVLLASVLVPLSTLWAGRVGGLTAALEAALLAALIAGAHRRPVRIGLKRKANTSTAPEVAAVLLLPGPLAVLAIVVGAVAGVANRNTRLVQRVFNLAVPAVRAATGLLVYAALLHVGPRAVAEPVAALAAAAAMYAVSTLLVVGIGTVQLRESLLRRSWIPARDTALADALLSLTGILAALATAHDAWALVLLIAPAIVAQRALRDGVALQAQTRLALEDLADIVDMRDHYTFEHSKRVAELARATARQLGFSAAEVDLIWMAGRVHDVGKIGIKSSVLMKPGRLDDAEFEEMRSHPEVGARLIANFPQFAQGCDLVRRHHERWDGKGYPGKLAGEAIPPGARVLAVADAWDAMTSHRAYRRALPLDHVYAELRRGRGTQFEPRVLDAFLLVLEERPDLAAYHTEFTQQSDVPAAETTHPTPARAPAPA